MNITPKVHQMVKAFRFRILHLDYVWGLLALMLMVQAFQLYSEGRPVELELQAWVTLGAFTALHTAYAYWGTLQILKAAGVERLSSYSLNTIHMDCKKDPEFARLYNLQAKVNGITSGMFWLVIGIYIIL